VPEDPLPIPSDDTASWRRRALDLLEFRPRESLALALLILAIVAGAAFAYARSLPRGAPGTGAAAPIASPSADASGSPSSGIVVHVAGAVAKPGVYNLPEGARVVDALRAAGGAAAGADLSLINLARPLTDGERVYFPRKGETVPGEAGVAGGVGGGGSSDGRVNLNTASLQELEGLPGIGEVLAQRILDYRTQHGPYRDVRDLLKVEGIGEKKFESIRDHVTV